MQVRFRLFFLCSVLGFKSEKKLKPLKLLIQYHIKTVRGTKIRLRGSSENVTKGNREIWGCRIMTGYRNNQEIQNTIGL